MAEIIKFPVLKAAEREKAIDGLALRLCAYLAASFYKKGIMEIPVQAFVYDMRNNMMNDGLDYDQQTLDMLSTDPAMLKRVEVMFITALIERGLLPLDFV